MIANKAFKTFQKTAIYVFLQDCLSNFQIFKYQYAEFIIFLLSPGKKITKDALTFCSI